MTAVAIACNCVWSRNQRAQRHVMEALRDLAATRCRKRNCGTACLCAPCHARRALETLDPLWRP